MQTLQRRPLFGRDDGEGFRHAGVEPVAIRLVLVPIGDVGRDRGS